MALKSFKELKAIDVPKEKRDGFDYLNWAKCIELLYEHGAERVEFIPLQNSEGSSLFMSNQQFTDKNGNTNRCYEVRIKAVVDGKEYTFQAPVMNGSSPVKDNSMSQQRVWNAQTRAFVKCIAINTGLGFDLWIKDDLEGAPDDNFEKHDLKIIQTRVQMKISEKMKKHSLSKEQIAEKLNITIDELSAYLAYFRTLDRLEKAIEKINT